MKLLETSLARRNPIPPREIAARVRCGTGLHHQDTVRRFGFHRTHNVSQRLPLGLPLDIAQKGRVNMKPLGASRC
jgi:hypothetical protein